MRKISDIWKKITKIAFISLCFSCILHGYDCSWKFCFWSQLMSSGTVPCVCDGGLLINMWKSDWPIQDCGLVGKGSAYSVRDAGSIPGWGRSPWGGNGNPFQCSCLENPMDMDREICQGTVRGVTRIRHNLVTKPQDIYKYRCKENGIWKKPFMVHTWRLPSEKQAAHSSDGPSCQWVRVSGAACGPCFLTCQP